MGNGADSVEEALENALDHIENREANYWVRTALQRMIAERDGPDRPPPNED